MKAVIKWLVIGVLGLLTLGVILIVGLAAVVPPEVWETPPPGQGQAEPQKATEKAQSKDLSKEAANGVTGDPADLVAADVEAYYSAASSGDYTYTYNHLTEADQAFYTLGEWTQANQAMGSDQTTYEILDIQEMGDGSYDVTILITSTGEERTTQFVNEGGRYVHKLTQPEYDIFSSAIASATASATASASASASAPAAGGGGAVQVEVVVEASEPVDVSIFDDTFSTSINEQVTSETYTFTKEADSGLSVSANTPDMTGGDISIKVYENGKLVHEDQASGMALVQY